MLVDLRTRSHHTDIGIVFSLSNCYFFWKCILWNLYSLAHAIQRPGQSLSCIEDSEIILDLQHRRWSRQYNFIYGFLFICFALAKSKNVALIEWLPTIHQRTWKFMINFLEVSHSFYKSQSCIEHQSGCLFLELVEPPNFVLISSFLPQFFHLTINPSSGFVLWSSSLLQFHLILYSFDSIVFHWKNPMKGYHLN